MQVLHEKFADNSSVHVVAVAVDDRQDPAGYLKENNFTYPAVLNGGELAKKFGVRAIPTFVVIGRDGEVIHKHTGGMNDEVLAEITSIVEEAAK